MRLPHPTGYKLYRYLVDDSAHHAYDGIPIPAGRNAEVDGLASRFTDWFDQLVLQPGDPASDAWLPEFLEYRFAVSAPNGGTATVLAADGYAHGHLDWYSVDADRQRDRLEPPLPPAPPPILPPPTRTFIPTALSFEGMPNSRWWTFEDSRTNFGDVKPGTTDLATLLLMEYALIYANDWVLFPMTLPVGTITGIEGLAVTNVFGERFWIEAAGRGQDEAWQRWSMFTLSVGGTDDVAADTHFLLLPTVPKVQDGTPLEEVALVRDEMANMVWAIETRIALPDGRSKPGFEAAADQRRWHERLVSADPAPPPPDPAAPVRYRVMSNDVPENWIPFIPVRVPDDPTHREIQLQRAALPRLIPRDPAPLTKIRPNTSLLREGLDDGLPYFVHEEEVPRSGIRLRQSYQRTRWYDGKVIVWLGIQKQTGRGEGSSNLRFDQLVSNTRQP